METHLAQMKEDYDQLVPGLSLDYQKLKLYMYFRKRKKGTILKAPNTLEKCSRYICKGYMGLMKQMEDGEVLKEIFGSTDVAFDFKSYAKEKKTKSYLICLSDVVYFEVSKESELDLVKHFPEFIKLGLAINHRLLERVSRRSSIKGKGIHKGYRKFLQDFPGIDRVLSQNKIATYFGCTDRTVRAVQKEYKETDL
ncbi:cAMP-binding domain of CRP or a regulatory subunit of cAMP-dependent protein kinases [Algoriphagus locisalis]|uniref:cAMP-binding domain of CRP or a regulatory subunit of cAMP-dependent protein kinases n=1 Tax=Algoriphagus locisalis TaxID=305507 RepID=A0A1I7CR24_9BACT|nr:hypothetical protein [Algoriphagus locisalis]SFU01885.1 cAMP-binding domain of CRP or a regulatory subunit of cAMP-dependent protein kinases [Algoriphagus locisalis]